MKKTVADSPDLLCQWNYKKNPDKFAIIATSEQAEKLKGNNNKLNL